MHSPASAFLRQFRRMGLVIEDDRVSLSDGVYSKCVQTIRSTHMSLAELVILIKVYVIYETVRMVPHQCMYPQPGVPFPLINLGITPAQLHTYCSE